MSKNQQTMRPILQILVAIFSIAALILSLVCAPISIGYMALAVISGFSFPWFGEWMLKHHSQWAPFSILYMTLGGQSAFQWFFSYDLPPLYIFLLLYQWLIIWFLAISLIGLVLGVVKPESPFAIKRR